MAKKSYKEPLSDYVKGNYAVKSGIHSQYQIFPTKNNSEKGVGATALQFQLNVDDMLSNLS